MTTDFDKSKVWALTDSQLLQVIRQRAESEGVDKKAVHTMSFMVRMFKKASESRPDLRAGLAAAIGLTEFYGHSMYPESPDFRIPHGATITSVLDQPLTPLDKGPAPSVRPGKRTVVKWLVSDREKAAMEAAGKLTIKRTPAPSESSPSPIFGHHRIMPNVIYGTKPAIVWPDGAPRIDVTNYDAAAEAAARKPKVSRKYGGHGNVNPDSKMQRLSKIILARTGEFTARDVLLALPIEGFANCTLQDIANTLSTLKHKGRVDSGRHVVAPDGKGTSAKIWTVVPLIGDTVSEECIQTSDKQEPEITWAMRVGGGEGPL